MSIVPIDSFEQWLGPEAAPNWKRRAFPDSQAIRQPGRLSRGLRAPAARVVAVPPRAALRQGLTASSAPTRSIGRSGWNGTESPAQVRRHEASNSAAFLEQFIERDAASGAIGRFTSCCTSACLIVPSSSTVTAGSSASRTCREIAYTEQSQVRRQARGRRFSTARGRLASTTAASSSSPPITAPISCLRVSTGESESLSLIPGAVHSAAARDSLDRKGRDAASSRQTGPGLSRSRMRPPRTSTCRRRSSMLLGLAGRRRQMA